MGNIIEKADSYIYRSVTLLVRLPNTRKKNNSETLIDTSTEALKRSKHWSILRLAKEKKKKTATSKFNNVMSQNDHGIESTSVLDAVLSVS